MKKFTNLLNGGVAHIKSFPISKPKKFSQFEEYEYDTAILYIGINDVLRFDKISSALASI